MLSTYLLVNIAIIIFPLFATFLPQIDNRLHYRSKLPAVFLASLAVAVPFLAWDYLAVEHGHWHFSPAEVSGISILNLPIEEILFFFTVPYSCLFLYESLRYFFNERQSRTNSMATNSLAALLLVFAFFSGLGEYTFAAFASVSIALFVAPLLSPGIFGSYSYLRYISICFLLFVIFNYILTSIPIVQYGEGHYAGIRILTIPAEDFLYNFSMLTLQLSSYLWIKKYFGIKG